LGNGAYGSLSVAGNASGRQAHQGRCEQLSVAGFDAMASFLRVARNSGAIRIESHKRSSRGLEANRRSVGPRTTAAHFSRLTSWTGL
jgi:hypothetical protein